MGSDRGWGRAAACEGCADELSGRSLRRARSKRPSGHKLRASAGRRLRPANRCAIDPLQKSPQPNGWACFRAARDCSPPPGRGCCPLRFRSEPQIKNSKRKIKNDYRDAACGGRARSGPAGRELRASATPRLRPAAVPFRNRKFKIQDSKFKITKICGHTCTYIPVRGAACGRRTRL